MRRFSIVGAVMLAVLSQSWAPVAANPFEGGWTLDEAVSTLRFQSVKNETKVEVSSFATLSGEIAQDGKATVRVALDSIDTGVDLRNVRMRFLFFETFQFPEATVSSTIEPEVIEDLPVRRRKLMSVPYTLDLHGVEKDAQAEVAVTLLSDDAVSVASTTPISVGAQEFGLALGVTKLEEAAGVDIIPSATVSFDFVFTRAGPPSGAAVAAGEGDPVTADAVTADAVTTDAVTTDSAAADLATSEPATTEPVAAAQVQPVALETQGEFSREECIGRFETISRTGSINFRTASARLDEASTPILRSIADVVQRCPTLTLEVSGHTDSDGGDAANLQLSERRAAAVAAWLEGAGIEMSQIVTKGYGETQPAFPNDTRANKQRNRRIEFAVLN